MTVTVKDLRIGHKFKKRGILWTVISDPKPYKNAEMYVRAIGVWLDPNFGKEPFEKEVFLRHKTKIKLV